MRKPNLFARRHMGTISRIGRLFSTLIRLAVLALILFAFWYMQPRFIQTKDYIFENSRIPKTLVGYNIVKIQDLANSSLPLEGAIDKAKPDLVIFTGNFVDNNGDYSKSVKLIKNISSKHRTLYVFSDTDEQYAGQIEAALSSTTNALNLSGHTINIQNENVDTTRFVEKYLGDSVIEKALDESSIEYEYLQYTLAKLEEDRSKSIVMAGLGICNKNTDFVGEIYRDIDLNDEPFLVVVNGQYQFASEISQTETDLLLTGNTFGKDPYSKGFKSGLSSIHGTTVALSNGIGDIPDGSRRFLNFPQIEVYTLSDGTINTDTPLEKFLSKFVNNVGTKFDNDGGFVNHTTTYRQFGSDTQYGSAANN